MNIRTIQELLGHSDVKTTMIYTHVVSQDDVRVVSPLDRLLNHSQESSDSFFNQEAVAQGANEAMQEQRGMHAEEGGTPESRASSAMAAVRVRDFDQRGNSPMEEGDVDATTSPASISAKGKNAEKWALSGDVIDLSEVLLIGGSFPLHSRSFQSNNLANAPVIVGAQTDGLSG